MKISTESILDKETLTELDIRLLCKRANAGEKVVTHREYKLTSEQTEKGKSWLLNQFRTPSGNTKRNHPFGWRESYVVDTCKEFQLAYIFDAGNNLHSWFVPVYRAIAKTGESFQYYVSGGKPVIIG